MEICLSAIACIISLLSLFLTLYTFHWTVRRDQKQNTLDAYNQLQCQALDYINLYKPSQIGEIAQNPRSDEYKKLGSYVARIEHFCVGVNQKIYDANVVYELAHGYFDGSLKRRIKPIIDCKNQSGEDYYANIHAVYAWMERETQNRSKNKSKAKLPDKWHRLLQHKVRAKKSGFWN